MKYVIIHNWIAIISQSLRERILYITKSMHEKYNWRLNWSRSDNNVYITRINLNMKKNGFSCFILLMMNMMLYAWRASFEYIENKFKLHMKPPNLNREGETSLFVIECSCTWVQVNCHPENCHLDKFSGWQFSRSQLYWWQFSGHRSECIFYSWEIKSVSILLLNIYRIKHCIMLYIYRNFINHLCIFQSDYHNDRSITN